MVELTTENGRRVGELPTTYLGFPLGASFKLMSAWYEVEEHFQKKAINVEKAIYLQRKETYFDTTHYLCIYFRPLFGISRKVRLR